MFSQASRFFAVGFVSTGVHLLVALSIVFLFSTGALAANIGGYCIAVLVSFFGHSRFSFEKEIKRDYFLRFLVINTVIFLVSNTVAFVLDFFQVNSYLGVFVTVGILLPLSFLTHKFVTFRE